MESTDQQCLAHELAINRIQFKTEYPLPVKYKGIQLDCGYRLDFLIGDEIILELKSVEQPKTIPEAIVNPYETGQHQARFPNQLQRLFLKDGLKSFVL